MHTWEPKARLKNRDEVSGLFQVGVRDLGTGGGALTVAPQRAAGKEVQPVRVQIGIAVKKLGAGLEHRSCSDKGIGISTVTAMEKPAKASSEAG